MSSDIAVSVRNLTKSYRLFAHPGDRVKQAMTFGLRKYHKEFMALKDVSFDIRKGEIIGVIGQNGAGKSTLLQLISGIVKPTSGTVKVNGRISTLLELGAGFNAEFTGRENVYFQGAVMGLSKAQMDERFDEIAEFADIGQFIDQQVRTYSSGMFIRLAFAMAIHVDPEILLVDEALAVGDMAFQRKCFDRIGTLLADNKRVVILVSHDLRQIERFCKRVIFLKNGQVMLDGDANEVCAKYHQRISEAERADNQSDIAINQPRIETTGEAEILEVKLLDESGREIDGIQSGAPLNVEIRYKLNSSIDRAELFVGTQTADCFYLSTSSTSDVGGGIDLDVGEHRIHCRLASFPVVPGRYFIRFAIRDGSFRLLLAADTLCQFLVFGDVNDYNRPRRLLEINCNWGLS